MFVTFFPLFVPHFIIFSNYNFFSKQDMVRNGEAMFCPECNTLIQKDDGCDYVKCVICQTDICWATKGRRWGPKVSENLIDQ